MATTGVVRGSRGLAGVAAGFGCVFGSSGIVSFDCDVTWLAGTVSAGASAGAVAKSGCVLAETGRAAVAGGGMMSITGPLGIAVGLTGASVVSLVVSSSISLLLYH